MLASTLVLPYQKILKLIFDQKITSRTPIQNHAVQPASLDLRLGCEAYRVAASFLPGYNSGSVANLIQSLQMHQIDLREEAVFEKGCVYVVKLDEAVDLPPDLRARANPKSSTGRLDIFARMFADGCAGFDNLPAGFRGDLYAEISPRTFSVKVREGDCLLQLRFLQEGTGEGASPVSETAFTVDVTGSHIANGYDFPPVIGWRARKHAGLIDLKKISAYSVFDYWEPVFARKDGGVILDPEDFYIFATKENLSVPVDQAAEMTAYDASYGEFRVHYAGFFDPGFGAVHIGEPASRGVLEVRAGGAPFLITEGQPVGKLIYSALTESPEKIYGKEIKSNYQGQGLKLAKQFMTDAPEVKKLFGAI